MEIQSITQEIYEQTACEIVCAVGKLKRQSALYTMGLAARQIMIPSLFGSPDRHFTHKDVYFFDLMNFVPQSKSMDPAFEPFQALMTDLRDCCGDMAGLPDREKTNKADAACEIWGDKNAPQIEALCS